MIDTPFSEVEQSRIASLSGDIYRNRALRSEAGEIMRSARFRARTRKTLAAKRLHADDGADHRTVDVNIPCRHGRAHGLRETLQPRMHAERQPIAFRCKGAADLVDLGGIIAHYVQ